jgi:hypothetical protein
LNSIFSTYFKSLVAKVGRGEPDLPIDEMAGTIIHAREVIAAKIGVSEAGRHSFF